MLDAYSTGSLWIGTAFLLSFAVRVHALKFNFLGQAFGREKAQICRYQQASEPYLPTLSLLGNGTYVWMYGIVSSAVEALRHK